ncbi:hypothetical protein HG619_09770 [Pseudomonas syringae]|nr:hypothetical protein [Pseudomonas syringae]
MALGVIEHKYVTERNGHVEVLEHAGTEVETTAFIRADGSRMEVARMLPAIPAYKPEIQAEIIAAQGMFVTVRISDTLQGLVGRKTVAGVLATLSDGSGQELVIEADRGVHYRGTVPIENFLALAPGETLHDQSPVALTLQKISPQGDPKRALPHLWHDQSDYRNGIAHDDFALELFYGAKAANEAYVRNPQWVARNIDAVAKIKSRLPSSITTVENPFYVLDTPEELAILFAARNQAALANTLLGHTIEWGAASRSRELSLGKYPQTASSERAASGCSGKHSAARQRAERLRQSASGEAGPQQPDDGRTQPEVRRESLVRPFACQASRYAGGASARRVLPESCGVDHRSYRSLFYRPVENRKYRGAVP